VSRSTVGVGFLNVCFSFDLLGDEFLEAVKTGDQISIKDDGTVEVG
jgi:hypothetical protein